MLKILTMFSGRDWLLLALACGLIVLGVWLDLTMPEYLREITMIATVDGYGTATDIWRNGGLMFAFAVGSMATAVIVSWIGAYVSSSHALRMRSAMFTRVGQFSMAEMKKFGVPSLITRSTNDITNVRMFTAMAIQMLIRAPITAVWAIMRIYNTSWELTLVTALGVVALVVLVTIIIIIAMPRFFKMQKQTDDLNKVARESLSGLRVVRAFNASEFEQAKFEKTNKGLMRTSLVVNKAMGAFWPFITFVMSMLAVGIYWVGSWVINSGRTDDTMGFFGDMMVFSQYSTMVVFSFLMLIMVVAFLPRTVVSAKRIMEVVNTEPTVVDGVGANGRQDVAPTNGEIKFNNVSFQYPNAESKVLSDIDIEIKQGSTVAFIGGTGCGKSTLVNLLPRIYDATDGEITIGDKCVRDFSLEELNKTVGYIPQTATIFKGTIRSNVAFGHELGDEEIWKALELSQAKDFVEKLENQLDHEVAAGGTNLSGGQKQRLSIARVVARKPEIYIFDDTFSALDYQTDSRLRAALKKNLKDATVLIVAQRVGTIRDAGTIYVMENGHIVSSGKHNDLMKKCPVYKEIATSQGVDK